MKSAPFCIILRPLTKNNSALQRYALDRNLRVKTDWQTDRKTGAGTSVGQQGSFLVQASLLRPNWMKSVMFSKQWCSLYLWRPGRAIARPPLIEITEIIEFHFIWLNNLKFFKHKYYFFLSKILIFCPFYRRMLRRANPPLVASLHLRPFFSFIYMFIRLYFTLPVAQKSRNILNYANLFASFLVLEKQQHLISAYTRISNMYYNAVYQSAHTLLIYR